MKREDFIKQQVEMLLHDVSDEQIKHAVCDFIEKKHKDILTYAIIYESMGLYAEIMVEFNRMQYEVQSQKPN